MSERKFNLDDYVAVNERVMKFYEKYKDGSIQTEILSIDNERVVIKAYAYRTQDDQRPSTGHAEEVRNSSYINKTSAVENCETSAVGRCIANLGFEIKHSIASKEEVQNAKAQQEVLAKKITQKQAVELDKIADEKGADKAKMLDFYKVNSFNEMTVEQFESAKTYLNKK